MGKSEAEITAMTPEGMSDYERSALAEVRQTTEVHFERAMREKDEAEMTRMGLVLDGLATVDPDRETFEAMFERVIRPHLPAKPPRPATADELDDDIPF
jgi:hypothetical protein